MASVPWRRGSKQYIPNFSSSKSKSETEEEQSQHEIFSTPGQSGAANFSSRYKNIISESNLIQPGPPAVYQLKPKKKEFESLTKITIGDKNLMKTNGTILLVGETGAGKSTLINALLNYAMGVKWEDEVWFQIVEEEKRRQMESQTSDVIVYEVFGFEDKTLPYSLTIIDTPGYGDTRGIKQDDRIGIRLRELFKSDDGIYEVNAVGLVMKAAMSRVSDRLKYVFDSVMSLFGKNMEKNIVALITHSDGLTPKNVLDPLEAAHIKCAKNVKNEHVHFLFNNQQKEKRTKESNVLLKSAWEVTQRGMRDFSNFLKGSESQKLMKSAEVMMERTSLTACIQNLKEKIKQAELKKTEIRQIQEALKKHEEEMRNNKNFTIEDDEIYKGKQHIDGGMWGLFINQGAVCCTVCEENCHYPGCTIAWTPEHCEVMKNGRCIVCTNKCPVSDHVKQEWIYVTNIKKVQKTLGDVKDKFEKNKSESEKKLSLFENLKNQMTALTAEKSQLLDESYQHVVKLEQIALKADSASTIVHLDFLIDKMMENGDTEKAQKLEEMKESG